MRAFQHCWGRLRTGRCRSANAQTSPGMSSLEAVGGLEPPQPGDERQAKAHAEASPSKSVPSWPEDCPRHCPGSLGEGCGAPVIFSPNDRGGGYFVCSRNACRWRWENVRTGRNCEFAISFSAISSTRFKLELISPIPTKVTSLFETTGLGEALDRAKIAYESERDGHELSFELTRYEAVVHAVAGCNLKVMARHLIPPSTLTALRTASTRAEGDSSAADAATASVFNRMPATLRDALLPFQREGVEFGIRRDGRALIADDMGVGKTVQAIALSACYADHWPLLIVVPASLRLTWANELERWLPTLIQPRDIHVIFSSDDRLSLRKREDPPRVTIISFKMLEILRQEIASVGFGVVIVDESHNMRTTKKARDSKQTEACAAVVKRVPRAILLTGTPSLSKPFDLFVQADALSLGLLGESKKDYSENYCKRQVFRTREGWRGTSVSGGRRLDELNLLLTKTVMIRRRKDDVLSQLPPKRRQVLYITPEARDWAANESHDPVRSAPGTESGATEGADREIDDMAPSVGYHATGTVKCRLVCDWLANALSTSSPGTKFLIFGHHLDVLDRIQTRALERSDCGYVRIDGSTPPQLRQDHVREFRSSAACRCALLSLTAAGVGLDFSSAHIVVFAELPREVSILEQAEARVHRKGLAFPVNVYFMCAKGTMDEALWVSLGTSLNKLKMVHDGQVGTAFSETKTERLSEAAPISNAPITRGEPIEGRGVAGREESQETGDEAERGPPKVEEDGVMDPVTSSDGVVPYFEISQHTDRIHVHSSLDGTAPLGINFSFEEIECALCGLRERASAVPFDLDRTTQLLAHFREEWNALRAYDRLTLRGKCLELPLNLEAVALQAGQRECTERHVPLEKLAASLPEGGRYEGAVVVSGRMGAEGDQARVKIPISGTGERLCCLCMSPMRSPKDATTAATEGGGVRPLGSRRDMFCSFECYDKASLCTSGAYTRRKLRELEKGKCQICGLDCIQLVVVLRAVKPEGSSAAAMAAALDERRRILYQRSEKFAKRGFRVVREKLLTQPIEGNAWQADHIIPVFQGGGCAGLDNMRTLCVCCHKEVTAKQAQLRANQRRAALGLPALAPRRPPRHKKLRRGPRKAKKYLSSEEETTTSSDDEERGQVEERGNGVKIGNGGGSAQGIRRGQRKARKYLSESDSESDQDQGAGGAQNVVAKKDGGPGRTTRSRVTRRGPRKRRYLSESEDEE